MAGIYDPSTMPGGYSFEKLKELIADRLHLVPPFRRRLVEVPFQLHHPVWVEDPDFDLDYHVRRIGCPAPRRPPRAGRDRRADRLGPARPHPAAVGALGDRGPEARPRRRRHQGPPLRHRRRVGRRAHGRTCSTSSPDAEPPTPAPSPQPEHVPTDLELLVTPPCPAAAQPGGVAAAGRPHGRQSATALVRNVRDPDGSSRRRAAHRAAHAVQRAPSDPTATVAFARVPLDDVKAVKDALGVTVNDVVLAVCCGGTLRRYLERTTRCPTTRWSRCARCRCAPRTTTADSGNKVSAMFTSLATDLDDPAERLGAIRQSTEGAKEEHNAIGARMLTDWAEFAAPRTFGLAVRLYSSMHLADQHRPIHNVVISNVPGPPFPLYLRRRRAGRGLPDGPDHGGRRPQHHGAQLPRPRRHRLHGRRRAGARRLGHGRARSALRSTSCSSSPG